MTSYEEKIEALPPTNEQGKAAMSPRRTFVFTTLTLLLVVVICLVGLEVGLRVYCLIKPNADVEFFRYASLMKANVNGSRVVFMHQPNMSLRLMGVDVQTNSRGFRDVEYAAQKGPGTKRIGLIGDSVTFGWGVPYGQRFSEIIESRWNAPGSAPVEVINTGHGNYNTTQESAMLEDYLSADDLDGVIQVWYINDAEPLPTHRDAPWYSHFYTSIFYWSKYDLVVRRAGNRKNYVDYYRDLYVEGSPGGPDFKQALQRTGDWTRRHNVPWVFVVLPEFHNFDEHNPFSNVYEEVKRTAAQAGAVVVDVTGDFRGQDPSSIWVAYNDVHPNAKGHAIIAEGILKQVDPKVFLRQPAGR
jgi:lysophospholipase L1-like esterase